MNLTQAELTILGLLIECPAHGYDLERVIEERGIRQWTDIGFSSIYYLLGKLEQRGLARSDPADSGAKSRCVYHPTDAGRMAARSQALVFIAESQPVAQSFLAGLANLPLLTSEEYAEALGIRLAQLDARIDTVQRARPAQLPLAAAEVFSYSFALMTAERAWLAARAENYDD